MKNYITVALIAIFGITFQLDAQTSGRFYASWDDLSEKKHIEGYEITGISSSRLFITTKEGEKKTKLNEAPSEIYTINGQTLRSGKKTCYIVLLEGPMCCYVQYFSQGHTAYSETIEGEIIYGAAKGLEKQLKKLDLFDEYIKDRPKREFNDSVNGYFNKELSWRIKYFKIVNEKLNK